MFLKNVKGKTADISKSNVRHDGSGGHWLEEQMGVIHNSSNTPDIDGFEMKNNTSTKTTFGDWSPNYKIWKKGNEYGLDRKSFLEIFGAPNILKENRHSWSGKPSPKISGYNFFGQKLEVDKERNIFAMYSFKEDKRDDKAKKVPKVLQQNNLILAKWDVEKMKIKVERKFNKRGWFKCLKDSNGVYSSIVFGDPINFNTWIDGVRKGLIFFDSGMYDGNFRPYANWRADNKYWDSLVTDTH
jgi:hypothetical protein